MQGISLPWCLMTAVKAPAAHDGFDISNLHSKFHQCVLHTTKQGNACNVTQLGQIMAACKILLEIGACPEKCHMQTTCCLEMPLQVTPVHT